MLWWSKEVRRVRHGINIGYRTLQNIHFLLTITNMPYALYHDSSPVLVEGTYKHTLCGNKDEEGDNYLIEVMDTAGTITTVSVTASADSCLYLGF